MNERIQRHFIKLYCKRLDKQEIISIFKAQFKHFDLKDDKEILLVSSKIIEVLAQFHFKNMRSLYYDSRAYGINMSLESTIQMLNKFVSFDWKVKDKTQIMQVWFDLIKRYYLYQFPVVFQSDEEKEQYYNQVYVSPTKRNQLNDSIKEKSLE